MIKTKAIRRILRRGNSKRISPPPPTAGGAKGAMGEKKKIVSKKSSIKLLTYFVFCTLLLADLRLPFLGIVIPFFSFHPYLSACPWSKQDVFLPLPPPLSYINICHFYPFVKNSSLQMKILYRNVKLMTEIQHLHLFLFALFPLHCLIWG